jgi:uncharacterized membrane protein
MSADGPQEPPLEVAAQPQETAPPKEISTDRMITLSDGVVAIALTLRNWISYVISFYVIAQFWTIHHRVFRGIRAHAGGLAAWNFLFLFTVSVMLFTSHLIGEFPENPLSVMIFSGNLILANVAVHAMLTFSKRRHLLDGTGLAVMADYRSLAGVIDISLYVISIPVALYSPDLGKLCWLGLALSVPIATQINKLRVRRHAAA